MRFGNPRLPNRFWDKVQPEPNTGCWLWTGGTTRGDYGTFYFGDLVTPRKGTGYAHRLSYRTFVGAIADGLQIDHLCRVRCCVNPHHLEPVTQRENILRGEGLAAKEARQTHCLRGHEFSEVNTYICKAGQRHCRKCRALRARQRTRAE